MSLFLRPPEGFSLHFHKPRRPWYIKLLKVLGGIITSIFLLAIWGVYR